MVISFSRLGQEGRLGNQLFQVAATVAAATRCGNRAKFPLWEYANAFKGEFNQTLRPSEIGEVWIEPHFHYSPVPCRSNLDLDGLFQSEKHFLDYEGLIRQQFEFVDDLLPAQWSQKKFDCSIHIRRGDYLTKPHFHTNLGLDYFEQAAVMMQQRQQNSFLVFSDDIEWCRRNFRPDVKTIDFVEGLNDIESLCLMSRCGNHIISNSSFSWWGSWLCSSKTKVTIAPSHWFSVNYNLLIPMDTRDLYCSGWEVIDHRLDHLRTLRYLGKDVLRNSRRYKDLILRRRQSRYWY